ncbi:MAG: endonuclease domain-containing protein [Phyllobacteriaceae bacterium]|nr:endonuclease domain-containing protein [Phyllobacteriaceae bacterium]
MPSHAPIPAAMRANARRMRRDLTDAELKFWNAVRAHRLEGLGFRRQFPVAGYIVDFACPERRIIVEIDGSQHALPESVMRAALRSRRFFDDGWKVVRFWNDDVIRDIDGVCRHILIEAGLPA